LIPGQLISGLRSKQVSQSSPQLWNCQSDPCPQAQLRSSSKRAKQAQSSSEAASQPHNNVINASTANQGSSILISNFQSFISVHYEVAVERSGECSLGPLRAWRSSWRNVGVDDETVIQSADPHYSRPVVPRVILRKPQQPVLGSHDGSLGFVTRNTSRETTNL